VSDDRIKNLKDLLDEFLRSDPKVGKPFLRAHIDDAWNRLLDEAERPFITKTRFEKGTLTVYVSSSTLREDLNRRKAQFLRALRKELGEETIQKIVFR